MRLTACAAGLVLVAGITGAALGCEGSQVLYEDKFDDLASTWGPADDSFFIQDGRLTITPGYDEYYSALNTMGLYDDIDLCGEITAVKADPDGNSFAGLIFWAIDYDNYYYLMITAEGSLGVFRRQRGRVLPQLRWGSVDTLKQGNGAVNELRIVTVGNLASIFVNGQFYASFKGQPPADGQQIGVRATSPRNDRGVWAFDDLKITVPEPPRTQ
jgi:hypothetical protein